jgi:hypothetical protein
VSVSVSQNGRVAERRSFPSMRSASRFFRKALYCGRKGAAFLPLGAQYRAVELQRARAALNGLGDPRTKERVRKAMLPIVQQSAHGWAENALDDPRYGWKPERRKKLRRLLGPDAPDAALEERGEWPPLMDPEEPDLLANTDDYFHGELVRRLDRIKQLTPQERSELLFSANVEWARAHNELLSAHIQDIRNRSARFNGVR